MKDSLGGVSEWLQTGIMLVMAFVMTGVIFVVDVNVHPVVNIGSAYCLIILYSWLLPGRFTVAIVALACTVLVILAAVLSSAPLEGYGHMVGINRIISIIVIWVSASLVAIAKRSFEGLERSKVELEDKVVERTEALLASQRKFETLLESAPDAMVIVDHAGRIQLVNDQVSNLFGYSKDELTGQPVEVLIPSEFSEGHATHRKGYFEHPKRRHMGAGLELKGLRKDGREFPVEVSLSPIESEDGMLVTAAIRDITDRKMADRELKAFNQQLQLKNKELEQFAYVASHDLQEPLRTVISFTELLSKKYSDHFDEPGQKSMQFILDATVRMGELIKGLLDYSRLGKDPELVTVDCNKLISDLKTDLTKALTDSSATLTAEPLPKVQAYKTELRLLFQNLISNALKFHQPDVRPEIHISATKTDSGYTFSIHDNGIGIAEEHIDRIFVIFQRLHNRNQYEGTGIGLAHCRKVVDLHGGDIWVESKLGEGSTFYFTIPN